MDLTLILSFFLGIGLAASAGFRVFLPLFALSLASFFGYNIDDSWAWVGELPALITLGVATLAEIFAYYIPWIDNALDTIAIPMAGIAGTFLMASSLGGFDSEVLQWGLAIISGGGTAAAIKGTAATGRLASTMTTGGLGNFAVSTGETTAASVLSIFAFIAPIIAFILVAVVFYFVFRSWRYINKVRSRKSQQSSTYP
ncbi:MAG: DUF4126 domain-containing protein [Weeksellaceae bacterium]|nr:DUF4126 domain-containing protein [Weeksellaceae bacterium]